MMKKTFIPIAGLALAACSGPSEQAPSQSGDLSVETQKSVIISQSDVSVDSADWGRFFPYFTQDTAALKPVLVGVAKLKAGEEVHPPHRHADEEYMMITRGRGEWYLNGETRRAKKGDILFARPWDYHGVKAADDTPLEFVVFKYTAKDSPAVIDPNPDLPELLPQE